MVCAVAAAALVITRRPLFATHSMRRLASHYTIRKMATSTDASTNTSTSSIPNLVSICHMRATHDKEHNRQQVCDVLRLAAEQRSRFVFLPECCDYVGRDRDETMRLAEQLDGPTVQFYRRLAKEHNVWLSVGGFHEAVAGTGDAATSTTPPPPSRIHNTHLIISSGGELVQKYQKLHLFDVDTPEFKFRESAVVNGGPAIVAPLDTPIGPLGLMICYDLRFAELSTILRKQGAQILTYPSAFAVSTGRAHWEIMLRARAIENQCFVVASAQIGMHNEKRESYGHAMVVDPFGRILTQCDNTKDVDVQTVQLDIGVLERVRRSMPCMEHRRTDVYSLLPVETSGWPKVPDAFVFQTFPIPPSTIFYQSEHSVAFTNIRCVVAGHVLVASRRGVHRLKELRPDEIADFFQTVCKVQRMLERVHSTSSSTVTVQDGELAGQTVRHVHCHIMPRRAGDFAQNDEIYVELERHDKPSTELPRRALEEMSAEAAEYREAMAAPR